MPGDGSRHRLLEELKKLVEDGDGDAPLRLAPDLAKELVVALRKGIVTCEDCRLHRFGNGAPGIEQKVQSALDSSAKLLVWKEEEIEPLLEGRVDPETGKRTVGVLEAIGAVNRLRWLFIAAISAGVVAVVTNFVAVAIRG